MKILSFGSLNVDKVYSVDHFVRDGKPFLPFEWKNSAAARA